MTAKQEAKRLINKFTFPSIYFADGDKDALIYAKFCSVQCIDEIINICPYMSKKNCETVEQLRANDNQFVSYWEEVKQEIKNK